MRRASFISIVNVVGNYRQVRALPDWLKAVYSELSAGFSDFELVLVSNGVESAALDEAIRPLPPELRQHLFVLRLSAPVDRNNALLAGLDRANGDYTVIFEFEFAENPQLIAQMWEKSQSENLDIVYLKAGARHISRLGKALYKIFYYILRKYSGLQLDPYAHHTRIISRRALNSLLRLRENSHYLKGIYALVGFNTGFIGVGQAIESDRETSFSEQFRSALLAITSFTTFLRTVLWWVFVFSGLVAVAAIFNAVKVKITHVDLFGDPQPDVTGWAFLVVLMSIFFALTCLNLYIMSIYLSNIYAEIKNRPLYIIESVKRY